MCMESVITSRDEQVLRERMIDTGREVGAAGEIASDMHYCMDGNYRTTEAKARWELAKKQHPRPFLPYEGPPIRR